MVVWNFVHQQYDALEKPEHCRNQSCEQHCVMTKRLTPYSERCFSSYGGILLQFATAKRRQAMESVYIYSIGEDGHSFLAGAVSRISFIDRVPPELHASLKEIQQKQTNMDETRHLPKFEIYTD